MATTVKVTLMGTDFRLQTDEPEAFVQQVASEVDGRLQDLRKRANLPPHHLAMLTALTLAEDLQKERDLNTRLRQEWADRLEALAATAARK